MPRRRRTSAALRPVLWSVGLTVATLTATAVYGPAASAAAPTPPIPDGPVDLGAVQAGGSSKIVDLTKLQRRLYVSPQGSDGGSGTKEAPFRTIQQAASVASPGTLVSVAPGRYAGSIETGSSGTASERIVYMSAEKWGAKLVGDGDLEAAWINAGDYVDIVDFDITGSNEDAILEEGSNVRVIGNRLHDMKSVGAGTWSPGYALKNVDFIGNVVHDNGHHGLYPAHSGGKVLNNIVYGNADYGIHCWHNCNKQTVSNNLVFENRAGGIIIGQGDSPNYGDVPADDCVVSNNIAVNNAETGIQEYGATGSGNRFLNNSVHGNGGQGIDLKSGTEEGTITADPQLLDIENGDFRVSPSSPIIGKGTELGAPSVDILGKPRPKDGGIDLGVFELSPNGPLGRLQRRL